MRLTLQVSVRNVIVTLCPLQKATDIPKDKRMHFAGHHYHVIHKVNNDASASVAVLIAWKIMYLHHGIDTFARWFTLVNFLWGPPKHFLKLDN